MSAGYRSPSAIWIGGAESPSTVPFGGYRSLEAFWIGGLEKPVAPIPPTLIHRIGARLHLRPIPNLYRIRIEKPKVNDDDEVLELLSIMRDE